MSVLKSVSQKLQHFSQKDIVESSSLRLWNKKSKEQEEDFGLQKQNNHYDQLYQMKILVFSFVVSRHVF